MCPRLREKGSQPWGRGQCSLCPTCPRPDAPTPREEVLPAADRLLPWRGSRSEHLRRHGQSCGEGGGRALRGAVQRGEPEDQPQCPHQHGHSPCPAHHKMEEEEQACAPGGMTLRHSQGARSEVHSPGVSTGKERHTPASEEQHERPLPGLNPGSQQSPCCWVPADADSLPPP